MGVAWQKSEGGAKERILTLRGEDEANILNFSGGGAKIKYGQAYSKSLEDRHLLAVIV